MKKMINSLWLKKSGFIDAEVNNEIVNNHRGMNVFFFFTFVVSKSKARFNVDNVSGLV